MSPWSRLFQVFNWRFDLRGGALMPGNEREVQQTQDEGNA
jgi:hypothetical protein